MPYICYSSYIFMLLKCMQDVFFPLGLGEKNSKDTEDEEEREDVANYILQEEEKKQPRIDAYYVILALILTAIILGVLIYFTGKPHVTHFSFHWTLF